MDMTSMTATNTTASYVMVPLAWGVWIPGVGWLRVGQRFFADTRREMAAAAARMYGGGAREELFDDSMKDLEQVFLEREKLAAAERPRREVWRWLIGTR